MREKILALLENYKLESGGNIVSRDLIRALNVDGAKHHSSLRHLLQVSRKT